MNLASTTQKVIGLVEEMTGVPVVVTPDSSLQTLAVVKIARHSAPAHGPWAPGMTVNRIAEEIRLWQKRQRFG